MRPTEIIPKDKFSYAVFGNLDPETIKLKFKSERRKSTLRHGRKKIQFQDKKCNIFQSGQQYLFSVALNRLHGEGTADALYVMSKQTRKYSTGELRAMIEIYKTKVEDIRRDKGLE